MMQSLGRSVFFGLLALPVAAACAGPRMAAPGDMSGAEVLPVVDRSRASGALVDESFKIGPYQIAEVDRDWNSGSGVGIGPWSKETKTTGFSYQLQSGKQKLNAKCASEHEEQGFLGLGGEFSWGDTTVACSCEGAGKKAEILLSGDGNTVKLGGKEYIATPVHEVQGGGTQGEPLGFRLDGDEPLGAAEVAHPGNVWLKKGLSEPERQQAACLFAGLMLYKPPRDD